MHIITLLFLAACAVEGTSAMTVGGQHISASSVSTTSDVPDDDADGFTTDVDCDDANADVNPSAAERCNTIDDNCDGVTDGAGAADIVTWYLDGDNDGYGDSSVMQQSCDGNMPRFVTNADDCDDLTASTHPDAEETCDGVDENCNGSVDEDAVDAHVYYPDQDGDGAGSDADDVVTVQACSRPNGYIPGNTDCDDTNAEIRSHADELCDGVDNNCDGSVDEDGAADGSWYYPDSDMDGYGDAYVGAFVTCAVPEGMVADNTDCDDWFAEVNPAAPEACNAMDDDCDGSVDEDVTDMPTWYFDGDIDGYGDPEGETIATCEMPWPYALNANDCDDHDGMVNPGIDVDTDGFSTCVDCDDRDWRVNPGAEEATNGYDDNCDGSIDE